MKEIRTSSHKRGGCVRGVLTETTLKNQSEREERGIIIRQTEILWRRDEKRWIIKGCSVISTERNESEADRSQPIVRSTVEVEAKGCYRRHYSRVWLLLQRSPGPLCAPLHLWTCSNYSLHSTLLYSTSPTTAIVFLSSSRVISSTRTVSNALYVRHLNDMPTWKL